MRIEQIYKKFYVMPNLADHMITTAYICQLIGEHWTGEKLNDTKLIIAALLHDIGNIVRFDFDGHPEFYGKEMERVNYWKDVQRKMQAKYTDEDHVATKKMLEEIHINPEIINWILEKSFGNSVKIADGKDVYLQLLYYADSRVMPHGIALLSERIRDIKERLPKYSERNDFKKLCNAAKQIEVQIQQQTNVQLQDIKGKVPILIKNKLLNISIQ